MTKLQITCFAIISVVFVFLIGMKAGERMEKRRWLKAIEIVQTRHNTE